MKIEILDEAETDLIEGFQFYEHQETGLGWYFFDSCSLISTLSFFPRERTTLSMDIIDASRNDFLFAVYYLVEGELIRVYAVLDCRRSPGWTRKRLNNPKL